MRTFLPLLQTLTATTLVLVGLGLLFWHLLGVFSISQELSSLPSLLRTLHQQAEVEELLEQEKGRIQEKQRLTQAILEDLLARRSTLREAGARFQALCDRHDRVSLQANYGDPTLSLEELFTRHVLELAQRELHLQSAQAGPWQAQLTAEWARLRASSNEAPWSQEQGLN